MYRAVFHGLSHGLAGAGFFFVRNPGPQHLRAGCAAGDEEAASGKGNYTGTATANFKILPKATGISNIVPGKKSFTAEWKKQANQTNGYIIQYSTDKNFKKDAKTKKITNILWELTLLSPVLTRSVFRS